MGFRGSRFPSHDRFIANFQLGHVDKVFESNKPMDIEARESPSVNPSPQKIRFWDVMTTPANKSLKYAIPLLRGVSDSITRGDLILYTIIGGRNFYLGPVNTKNIPSNSADHTYDELKGDIGQRRTDLSSGYNESIPRRLSQKLAKQRNAKMDFVGEKKTTDDEQTLKYSDTIFTDLTLEGRYGNSIRLGARDMFPHTIISNQNTTDMEKMQLGTSTIGMTSMGAIDNNFPFQKYTDEAGLEQPGYRLSCDIPIRNINVGNDVVIPEVPENTFNYDYSRRALDLEEPPNAQIIISSDRIIFDSMHEDITVSSNRNINLGANKNFTLTNKGFSVFETKNIYIGKEAKNRTQPMVLGEQLRLILIRILRLLADAYALGDMNVPQRLTVQNGATQGKERGSSIHTAGSLREEVESIMKQFNLGSLEEGVIPPIPEPSIQLNVEDGIPTGDRITGQPTFLSQYHFIEENLRPDPTEETTQE